MNANKINGNYDQLNSHTNDMLKLHKSMVKFN